MFVPLIDATVKHTSTTEQLAREHAVQILTKTSNGYHTTFLPSPPSRAWLTQTQLPILPVYKQSSRMIPLPSSWKKLPSSKKSSSQSATILSPSSVKTPRRRKYFSQKEAPLMTECQKWRSFSQNWHRYHPQPNKMPPPPTKTTTTFPAADNHQPVHCGVDC